MAERFDGTQWTAADRALIEYADRLTLAPSAIASSDVECLRAAGFDDRAIHDACTIVAYFAFVNRIADGLGVEIEEPTAEAATNPTINLKSEI
jgi:alkylhydroperoxidase family enzyme